MPVCSSLNAFNISWNQVLFQPQFYHTKDITMYHIASFFGLCIHLWWCEIWKCWLAFQTTRLQLSTVIFSNSSWTAAPAGSCRCCWVRFDASKLKLELMLKCVVCWCQAVNLLENGNQIKTFLHIDWTWMGGIESHSCASFCALCTSAFWLVGWLWLATLFCKIRWPFFILCGFACAHLYVCMGFSSGNTWRSHSSYAPH